MEISAADAGGVPRITFMNMSGDVTVTWDEENRDKVIDLVRRKMKQGYAFFIVRPVGSKGRPPVVKDADQLKAVETRQVKVSSKFNGKELSDEELVAALTDGVVRVEPVKVRAEKRTPAVRAETPEQVVAAEAIAMKPIAGG